MSEFDTLEKFDKDVFETGLVIFNEDLDKEQTSEVANKAVLPEIELEWKKELLKHRAKSLVDFFRAERDRLILISYYEIEDEPGSSLTNGQIAEKIREKLGKKITSGRVGEIRRELIRKIKERLLRKGFKNLGTLLAGEPDSAMSADEDTSPNPLSGELDLTPRQKKILILSFGLNGERKLSDLEIAQKLNIKKVSVSKIRLNAFKKIEETSLERAEFEDFLQSKLG